VNRSIQPYRVTFNLVPLQGGRRRRAWQLTMSTDTGASEVVVIREKDTVNVDLTVAIEDAVHRELAVRAGLGLPVLDLDCAALYDDLDRLRGPIEEEQR